MLHGAFHQVQILDLQGSGRGVAHQFVVVGADDDGDPFLVDAFQVVENFERGVGVEVAGWFVGKDDEGLAHQCSGDGDSLLLSS